jgi:hypothetical protein
MAINTESKSATPTAILADTPHATRRGITSTGPPAPEREQIAPVVIPRKIRNPIWSAIDFGWEGLEDAEFFPSEITFFAETESAFRFSFHIRTRMEAPENSTTR